jgi:hypothetical protein
MNGRSNVTRNSANSVEGPSARTKPPRRSAEQRANAAKRMRWARERRRLGLRCYTLEIRNTEIMALISGGYLRLERCRDRGAVVAALHAFLDTNLK